MGADSCLRPVKLFSQSGSPAPSTDGEVGKVVITFSNVPLLSGFVIIQTPSLPESREMKRGRDSVENLKKYRSSCKKWLLPCERHWYSRHWSKWAFSHFPNPNVMHPPVRKANSGSSVEKSVGGELVVFSEAEAALSKFVSSEELIDLAKDLVCLPLGEVSNDRALAFYPLRVAANLRQGDRVLISAALPPRRHPSPTLTPLDAPEERTSGGNAGNEPWKCN